MYCEKCGKEIPEGNKFCTHCGAPVRVAGPPAEQIEEQPEPAAAAETQQLQPEATQVETGATQIVPPPVLPAEKPATPQGAKKTKILLLILIPVILLVIAGAVVGIVLWTRSGPTLKAEIKSLDLDLGSGDRIDLENVPLGETLLVTVEYLAVFPEGGEGTLQIMVLDSEGNDLLEDNADKVKSNDKPQTFEYEYYMEDNLAGESLDVSAVLEVKKGTEESSNEEELAYKASSEGGTKPEPQEDLTEARQQASARATEARAAIDNLSGQGIDVSGLPEMLQKALHLVEHGTTLAELMGETDSAMFYSNYILNECHNRYQAYLERKAREQDIAAAQQVMMNYAYANTTQLEGLHLQNFYMNNERTIATALLWGMVTAHTDPENAGTVMTADMRAEKSGGQWVVTGFNPHGG